MVSTTEIADLPWVFPIYQQVTQAFSAGYGHHALLIRSANDNGAEQCCFALAQWLLCENKQAAQAAADALVEGGVRAIWNFAPVHLALPADIAVKNEDMAASLAILSRRLAEILKNEK